MNAKTRRPEGLQQPQICLQQLKKKGARSAQSLHAARPRSLMPGIIG
jgi:hypothetical protein